MDHMHVIAAGVIIFALYLLLREGFTPEPSGEWPYKEQPMPLNRIAEYDADSSTLRQKEADMLAYTPQPATLFPTLPTW